MVIRIIIVDEQTGSWSPNVVRLHHATLQYIVRCIFYFFFHVKTSLSIFTIVAYKDKVSDKPIGHFVLSNYLLIHCGIRSIRVSITFLMKRCNPPENDVRTLEQRVRRETYMWTTLTHAHSQLLITTWLGKLSNYPRFYSPFSHLQGKTFLRFHVL